LQQSFRVAIQRRLSKDREAFAHFNALSATGELQTNSFAILNSAQGVFERAGDIATYSRFFAAAVVGSFAGAIRSDSDGPGMSAENPLVVRHPLTGEEKPLEIARLDLDV
jgi:hypothetical protein